jgi:hypothetical protein
MVCSCSLLFGLIILRFVKFLIAMHIMRLDYVSGIMRCNRIPSVPHYGDWFLCVKSALWIVTFGVNILAIKQQIDLNRQCFLLSLCFLFSVTSCLLLVISKCNVILLVPIFSRTKRLLYKLCCFFLQFVVRLVTTFLCIITSHRWAVVLFACF